MGWNRVRGWACLAALPAVALTVGLAAHGAGHDWPQFRGADRDGVSGETGLLPSWPDSGPREVWRVPLGEGYSGVSVVGDRLYTMYAADHEGEPRELAAAFDAQTGKQIWTTVVGKRYDNEFGNGPRATPTVHGKSVYVLGSHGDLLALSADDGKIRWQVNLPEKFGSKVPYFGYSTSALADGDRVIVEAGGPEGKSYVALDSKTGEVQWTYGDPAGEPGYSSPIAVTVNGERRYVYVLADSMGDRARLISLDQDGNEVWSHAWRKGESIAVPIFVPPNKIFASGAEGVGAALVRVSEKEGNAEVEQLWATNTMKNHFSSSVIHDGHVYGFDNATLRAISLETGETAWAKRGLGKGSLILADGHLIVLSDRGKLVLVEATPRAYVEKGSVQALEGRCWTAPSLANGRLYLRNHEQLVSFDLKG